MYRPPVSVCSLAVVAALSGQAASADDLVFVRPYPTANDLCQVIGESAATQDFLDDSHVLIGCPANETGAIEDRQAEGAKFLQNIGNWKLYQIPNNRAAPAYTYKP